MGYNSELYIQIQDELINTINQVEEGEFSHLDALISFQQSKEQLEKSLEIIKNFQTDKMNEISDKASEYGGKYQGYEIKSVSGRKLFSFKGIEEYDQIENTKKQIEEKYKSAFDGFQKGTVTAEYDEGRAIGWYDPEGVLQPFPELTVGKSYITVSKAKK